MARSQVFISAQFKCEHCTRRHTSLPQYIRKEADANVLVLCTPVYQTSNEKYEGSSTNKLQNDAVPLILKTGKIRNIRFVGNLILNIHRNLF